MRQVGWRAMPVTVTQVVVPSPTPRILVLVCAATAACLIAAAIPLSAGDLQADAETARQVLLKYSERVRWQHYWLPDTMGRSYAPGAEIEVHALFSTSAAGFCAPKIEVCQIYERHSDGRFRLVTEWKPDPPGPGMPLRDRFAAEYARAKSRPVREVRGNARSGQPRSFDATTLVAPLRSRPDSVSFGGAISVMWKLPPLDLPVAIKQRVRPTDAGRLAAEVVAAAKSYHRRECGAGKAIIPFYDMDDPRVYIEVDLGGRCEKGVFVFSRGYERDWSLEAFTVAKAEIEQFAARIQRAKMETVRLGR